MVQAVLLVQEVPVAQHLLSVPDPHHLQVAPKIFKAGVKVFFSFVATYGLACKTRSSRSPVLSLAPSCTCLSRLALLSILTLISYRVTQHSVDLGFSNVRDDHIDQEVRLCQVFPESLQHPVVRLVQGFPRLQEDPWNRKAQMDLEDQVGPDLLVDQAHQQNLEHLGVPYHPIGNNQVDSL